MDHNKNVEFSNFSEMSKTFSEMKNGKDIVLTSLRFTTIALSWALLDSGHTPLPHSMNP